MPQEDCRPHNFSRHSSEPSIENDPVMLKHIIPLLTFVLLGLQTPAWSSPVKVLFLGDNGHHQPAKRFDELAPALKSRGIELTYSDRMEDLNGETLAQYAGLLLYANIDRIERDQVNAVLEYVEQGGGFIPIHCATYCWRNSPEMIALMGGQFLRHGGQVFTTEIATPTHPLMDGYGSFVSWDETYIHHLHNEENRTILEYRVQGEQAEGKDREPWTWVRTHGDGRVFYTAWGHDQRTFTHAGFHNLLERGIRWACQADPGVVPAFSDPERFVSPGVTPVPQDESVFEYVDVGPKIPNYTPGEKWGSQGKPRNLMQKPLSPEESIKRFVTPRGMAVKRYADERNFDAKPIAMTWDERGRLWICETVDYPNELGRDRDRIRICEDTDGDNVADRFTIFAEGLSIPTAIVIVRGGAVVQNGTETIYLKDTNGDDVADENTTLISNWTLGDTHGGVSNFRYGLDNWIWGMQGYNNSSPQIDGKPTQTFRQGFWRFKLSQTDPPKVTDLEFIRSSDNNTWGLGISEEGLIFGSTANHNPSMFTPIPNRYYERVRGWAPNTLHSIADTHMFDPITEKVRQVDHHGGYTAAAGHALYTARAFPQQWWNKTSFVCGPTGHLIGTFVLRRDGANYTSDSPLNLLASDDEWSAPVLAEVGPDGAVWVIDWYNYIVQHNPTPAGFETGKGAAYESDLRDKRRGRIYRVVAEGQDGEIAHDFSDLSAASNAELIKALRHPSFPWRLQAQRLLIERNARDVAGKLQDLIADESVDEIGLNPGAIHALWVLHELELLQLDNVAVASTVAFNAGEALQLGLKHPSAGVRRNALAVLPHNGAGLSLLLENTSLCSDDDAQVRLQAILSLADMPAAEAAGNLIVSLANGETDPILVDALTSAASVHSRAYLAALGNPASESAGANIRIARRVAEHVGRSRPDAAELTTLLASLKTISPQLATSVVDGVTAGLPSRFEFQSTDRFEAVLVQAFQAVPGELKGKLIRLGTQCRTDALEAYVDEMVAGLVKELRSSRSADAERVNAARELIQFRPQDSKTVATIVSQIDAQSSPDFVQQLMQVVRQSQAKDAGEEIIEATEILTPQLKSTAIDTLLTRPAWSKTLLTAIEERNVDLAELSLEQKQALRAFPDKELQKRAEKLLSMKGGLPDANREKVLKSLLHLTERDGDVAAGRAVYTKVCAACHKHGELGTKIGPDLTGMAVHPKEELLTHIIDPSRNVEGNYRMYTIVTIDGNVINGMLAGETRTTLSIVDAKGKKTDLAREDIEELLASRKSVMPEGFEKQISEQELTDLLEFLTSKGRFVPVPLARYATAVSTKGMFSEGDNGPDRLIFETWDPKTFNDVPFVLTDPRGKTTPNVILLHGPFGPLPPRMPRSVELPCNTVVKKLHLLSGVGGWNFPYDRNKSVSMVVRLHYANGSTEDHELLNGVHFADYIRRVDVPESEFAFALGDQQVRYLSIAPKTDDVVESVELLKGNDNSAPIVMAVTIER